MWDRGSFQGFPPVMTAPHEGMDGMETDEYPGGTETILLAEDEPDLLDMTRTLLEMHGYRVIPAEDGQRALEQYLEHQEEIDLLLLDVMMPRKNGADAFEAIHAIRPGVPVLFVTGYVGQAFGDSFRERHRPVVLYKPFRPAELLQAIRRVLDGG